MKFSKFTIAFYLALVFVSGAVLGAVFERLYNVSTVSATKQPKSPEEFRKGYLKMMQDRLNLSQDQVAKLGSILDETRARVHEVHQKLQPDLDEVRKEQQDKVRSILSADQRAEYEKMLIEHQQHQQKQGGRGGGPGI